MRLQFSTPEEAIEYCKHNGFDFEVSPEPKSEKEQKSYADNFVYQGPKNNNDKIDWD